MSLRLTFVVIGLLVATRPAGASIIDFEDLTGPDLFASATAPQSPQYTFGPLVVDITGGVILDETAFLPANQTSVYGTASFCCGTGTTPNLLTVTFSDPINNFFLDVLNGSTVTTTYRLSDNNGNVADFALVPNLSSGQTQIGFAATGTVVTIEALTGLPFYDFLSTTSISTNHCRRMSYQSHQHLCSWEPARPTSSVASVDESSPVLAEKR